MGGRHCRVFIAPSILSGKKSSNMIVLLDVAIAIIRVVVEWMLTLHVGYLG